MKNLSIKNMINLNLFFLKSRCPLETKGVKQSFGTFSAESTNKKIKLFNFHLCFSVILVIAGSLTFPGSILASLSLPRMTMYFSHQKTKKRGSFAKASLCGTDVPRSSDTRKCMITQPIKNVKLNMAESGGNDPHPEVNRDDSCIKRSPTLWNSLSNHIFSITKIILSLTFFVILVLAGSLTFPGSVLAANTGQFSAEVWVKPTSSIASQALLGKAEELRIFTDASGFVGCQIKATTWQTAATATTNALTLNSWAHVACTYDKSNIKVYVNGVQVATQAETDAPDDTAAAFEIGEDDSASTTYTNLTGTVDNFQFYNYAINQKQIVSDMTGGDPSSQGSSGRIAGAIAHYRFDEGQGITANNSGSQGSTLNGTLTSMSSPATATSGWTQAGKYGKALIFDGSNDYVSITRSATLEPTNITVECWVKFTAFSGSHQLCVTKQVTGAGANSYALGVIGTTNKPIWVVATAAGTETNVQGTALSTGTWYHLVGTYDGTTMVLYVNGNAVASSSPAITIGYSASYNIDIGAEAGAGAWYTNGSIDEVKIYNYALTADEVKAEFNRGQSLQLGALGNNTSYTPQATNQIYCVPGDSTSCVAPVAEWNFDEGSGTSVKDTSGNNNTGTWAGTGTKHWDVGKIGSAGKFNGTDDYVGIGVVSALAGNLTFEAWIKPNSVTGTHGIGGAYANVGGDQWSFGILMNGAKLRVVHQNGANYRYYDTDNSVFSVNGWTHVSITRTSTSYTVYINGQNQTISLALSAGTDTLGSNQTFSIGTYGVITTATFNGLIDQVRIFNYARSAAQIAWDYNQGKPVGHWKFDECQGSVAHDSSGNNNSGTITVATGNPLGTCTTANSFWGGSSGTGAGKVNYAPTFDGVDDYVSVGNISALNPNNLTASAWVYWAGSAGTEQEVLGKWGSGGISTTAYVLGIDSSGKLFTKVITATPTQIALTDTTNFTANTWVHVTVTYDGTTVKLYKNGIRVNGTQVGSDTGNINSVAASFYIGAIAYTRLLQWTGLIDDVRIYNYALTAAQVKTLYNNGAVFYGPVTGAP